MMRRTEIESTSKDEARRLLVVYRGGGHDRQLEDDVLDELGRHGLVAKGRPRLVGTTNGNPPLLLLDTDVESGLGT